MSLPRKISVIGLGYVGLPVAVAFGNKAKVIGFDIQKKRIEELKRHFDRTREVSEEQLKAVSITFTDDKEKLREADFHIVAVPTPVTDAKEPDFTALIRASETVGSVLKKGDIVVYESTVYPGATEEHCVPILEKVSGLKCLKDFTIGYSPERINPGDHEHTFTKIKKVVSGQTPETLEVVAQVYGSVVEAGVHKATSVKAAEAAKVIENIQRDVNIALMNELAMIFHKMGIDTTEVLNASKTKWNFLPFSPGLVGGHCIGVDPYYLTHIASRIGYTPQMILSGRRINDSMGSFVATNVVKELIHQGVAIRGAVVTVLGLSFKENVSDIRNTKVVDIIRELQDYGVQPQVVDPLAAPDEAVEEYGIELTRLEQAKPANAVVLAVPHAQFLSEGWGLMKKLLQDGRGLVADVKSRLDTHKTPDGIRLWRL